MDEKEKEILAEMREKSKVPNTPEYMLYALLNQSHPAFVEQVEEMAVKLTKSVQGMVEFTKAADDDPAVREAFNREIRSRAPNSTPSAPQNSDKDEDK